MLSQHHPSRPVGPLAPSASAVTGTHGGIRGDDDGTSGGDDAANAREHDAVILVLRVSCGAALVHTCHTIQAIVIGDSNVENYCLWNYRPGWKVHSPLELPSGWEGRFDFIKDSRSRKHYHTLVSFVDEIVGNLTAIMRSRDNGTMWDNTLVVSSSDNGGPIYGADPGRHEYPAGAICMGGGANNFPLRGGKQCLHG